MSKAFLIRPVLPPSSAMAMMVETSMSLAYSLSQVRSISDHVPPPSVTIFCLFMSVLSYDNIENLIFFKDDFSDFFSFDMFFYVFDFLSFFYTCFLLCSWSDIYGSSDFSIYLNWEIDIFFCYFCFIMCRPCCLMN